MNIPMIQLVVLLALFSAACAHTPAEKRPALAQDTAVRGTEREAEWSSVDSYAEQRSVKLSREVNAERSSARLSGEVNAERSSARLSRDSFTLAYLMGKFDPATHPDFEKVDIAYADREGHYLRRDAYEAFKRMHAAALAAGVRLKIISAARNFNRQKEIWEAKWNGNRLVDGQDISQTIPDPVLRARKILEYSSMPGSSRHHWGTDIDLNALTDAYFLKGEGLKILEWLSAHAHEYGFCRPYTAKGPDRPNGYEEEKWHWSYQPVAKELAQLARNRMDDSMIEGFKGAETATRIGIVKNYVLGVSGDCLR